MRSNLKREASRQRIIDSAAREFRRHGLGGIGVDGLAKGADMTSGAFYFHFPSKIDAFIETVKVGLDNLREGIEKFRLNDGPAWVQSFARFYMGERRTCDIGDGCGLPSLSAEVERSTDEARQAYQAKINEIAQALADGLKPTNTLSSREQAFALMSLLAGGVMISRAVHDPALSEEIGAAVEKAANAFGFKATTN